MNPSDEEDNKVTNGTEDTQTSEEIEELLEPQAIPDERIVRHAETNDSYREEPSLVNDEEIIQPPLEPEEVEPETESEIEPESEQANIEPSSEAEELKVENLEQPADDVSEATPPVTQEDIMNLQAAPLSQVEIEPTIKKEVAEPLVTITASDVPLVPEYSAAPLTSQPTGQPAGGYHTVSGGPETIHDIQAGKLHSAHPEGAPISAVHSNESSASGYTIPNPNYVVPAHVQAQEQSSFGSWLFLIILAILGGGGSYFYFFMPETFDKFYDAVMVVFNELIKK